ncbi:MAG: NADH-quinone oxidoreductase subunit NuoK [Candidatus Sumerlaeia bacterium]|nr:NADH-quinone oxidoreductase subunit NuoK [Candidatus Sumerlaeia bacterium]
MSLSAFLLVSLVLFSAGLVAIMSRRNLVTILVGIELMLNAASINFMAFNYYTAVDPVVGQIIVLVIIGLAAAEVAIFLSILMVLYRARHDVDVEEIREIRG